MPVAPVVVLVMFVKAVLIQTVGVLDGAPAVLFALTVTITLVAVLEHPPEVTVLLKYVVTVRLAVV
jgi:hypothetical protein